MTIGEAARASGLPTKTVRYYSDIGLVRPVTRQNNGYRNYDDTDLRRLVFVRRARAFGFSVEDCRELLSLYSDPDRSSADVKRIATARLAQIEEKQRELQSLRDELSHLVRTCRGDDRPDCPIIDYLS